LVFLVRDEVIQMKKMKYKASGWLRRALPRLLRLWLLRALLLVSGTLSVCACSKPAPKRHALEERDVFIALERDFQNFRSWGSIELDAREAGETHPAGPQRTYVNALPPADASEFPVGTMFVKDAVPEGGERKLFGMVKRGADYNAKGARGWEWFELHERADESVAIKWRGLGAPAGEAYGGDPSGTCNTCHQRAFKNDFVRSSKVVLRPEVAQAFPE
jgi:hypothetical protein